MQQPLTMNDDVKLRALTPRDTCIEEGGFGMSLTATACNYPTNLQNLHTQSLFVNSESKCSAYTTYTQENPKSRGTISVSVLEYTRTLSDHDISFLKERQPIKISYVQHFSLIPLDAY